MELLVMHIDNRVESLEEARKYLNDEFLNNECVFNKIYLFNYIFLGKQFCTNFFFSFFFSCSASGTNQGAIDNRIEQAMVSSLLY